MLIILVGFVKTNVTICQHFQLSHISKFSRKIFFYLEFRISKAFLRVFLFSRLTQNGRHNGNNLCSTRWVLGRNFYDSFEEARRKILIPCAFKKIFRSLMASFEFE